MDKIIPKIVSPSIPAVDGIEKAITERGTVYSLNFGDNEFIRISVILRAGANYSKKPFVASSVVNMLKEGTALYPLSKDIAEQLDFYAAHIDSYVDKDYAVVSIYMLNKHIDNLIPLFASMLNEPLFNSDDLELYKEKRHKFLMINREKVSFQSREMLFDALYGKEHPYGRISESKDIFNLKREDLVDFHKELYFSKRDILIIGDVSSQQREAINKTLLEPLAKKQNPIIDTLKVQFDDIKPQDIYVEKESASQTSVRLAMIIKGMEDKDYHITYFLSFLLGGYFGSRLINNLREDKGYTYGIFSTIVTLKQSSFVSISTSVAKEVKDKAIEAICYEIDNLSTITDEEIEIAKKVFLGEILRSLDGGLAIADIMCENILQEVDFDYIRVMAEKVMKLNKETLAIKAKEIFKSSLFTKVAVG